MERACVARAPIAFCPMACLSQRSVKAWSGPHLLLTLLLRADCREGDREELKNLDMHQSVGRGKEREKITERRELGKKMPFCCEGIS